MKSSAVAARPGGRAARSPLRQFLAPVVLVMGLFAMHGLGSSHSGVQGMQRPAPVTLVASESTMPASTAGVHPKLAAPEPKDVRQGTLRGSADGHGAAAAVCLAILSAAALSALALRLWRVVASFAGSRSAHVLDAARRDVPRAPPDLHGLGISRT